MEFKIGDKIRITKTMVFFCEKNLGKVDTIIKITDCSIVLDKLGTISLIALNCLEKVDDDSQDIVLENSVYQPKWERIVQ